MKKKIIKSKMIRDDSLQIDCENSDCYNGLDPYGDDSSGHGNGIYVGEEMICTDCGQVYHWGTYIGVKMTLVRSKRK